MTVVIVPAPTVPGIASTNSQGANTHVCLRRLRDTPTRVIVTAARPVGRRARDESAWASPQSQVVAGRDELELRYREAEERFAGQDDLVLLWIDPPKVKAGVIYERLPGVEVGDLYPHIYGGLNADAVVGVSRLEAWKSGGFVLPPQPAT